MLRSQLEIRLDQDSNVAYHNYSESARSMTVKFKSSPREYRYTGSIARINEKLGYSDTPVVAAPVVVAPYVKPSRPIRLDDCTQTVGWWSYVAGDTAFHWDFDNCQLFVHVNDVLISETECLWESDYLSAINA
jgi:hypothetical protein